MDQQMARNFLTTQVLACVLPLVGCYALMGAEHNDAAARDLEPGMSLSECLEELADGGRVEVQWALPIDTPEERESVIEGEDVSAALADAESTVGRHAVRALYVVRWWGFMGFGEVHLFLDAQDDLVGYHLFHVN